VSNTLKIVKANFEARQARMAELRAIDEAATGRDYDADETAKVAELRSDLEAIDGRIQAHVADEIRSVEITDATSALLGRLDSRLRGDDVDNRSIGEVFRDSDEVRSFLEHNARGQAGVYDMGLDFRAVTNVTTGATSAGAFINNDRLTRIGRDLLDRKTFVLDLLPRIPVGTGSVEYVQDQTPLADLADVAAETAEATAKPQAGPTLAVVTEPTQTVAVWENITRQAAADVPQMTAYLDGRLRYSIKRRADKQVLAGTGAGNIQGISGRSGILTYAPGAAEARYVTIRHSQRLMEDVETVPEIIVLNPADAEIFDLSNSTTAGIHANPDQFGGVATAGPRTAWGLTQVRSTAVAAGTAFLIDPMALAVLDRQQVSAYMTDSHASNFTSNILTLLLEARLGLALFDPKGVLKITFNGTV
jgi:HK97 family phage major capsid protein